MPSSTVKVRGPPGLESFLVLINSAPLEKSIETLISYFKRRQIKGSRACAQATGSLLKEVIDKYDWTDVDHLIEHIQQVGRRLSEAQPTEMVVANIVRRVLSMIRVELEDNHDDSDTGNSRPETPISDSPGPNSFSAGVPTLRRVQTSRPSVMSSPSLFNLLALGPDSPSHTPPRSMTSTAPITSSGVARRLSKSKDKDELKMEIFTAMHEILDELSQVEDQIAAYGPAQIIDTDILLTHSASVTVQKFLLKAAHHRKFTLYVVETFPNENEAVYEYMVGKPNSEDADEKLTRDQFKKPLTAAGIDVIFCRDTMVVAAMAKVHKVIISPHVVLANGGLVTASGARLVAKAARAYHVPVIALSGVYKLSPEYPFDPASLTEYGNPGKIIQYQETKLRKRASVVLNPLLDYVAPDLVNLYITNLGPCAPSSIYRLLADHYKRDDINFNKPELNL